MAHDDPFTIDLFGTTAPASGFDLGVPGFAADFGTDIDIDPQPSTPAPAAAVRKEPKPTPQIRTKVNFSLQSSRGLGKTWRDRAHDNISAIVLAKSRLLDRRSLPNDQFYPDAPAILAYFLLAKR
ncbi:hypothetical protein [Rhizobium lentis]|uniref:hypothetical protein n=1 Tax=Rhizobium lentis TaxID=1138194 RepID=UPI002180D67F|nr:hypothetical protein [Rhizobium lentis]